MSVELSAPTIVLGLGAFGGEVVRRVEPLEIERLALLASDPEQEADTEQLVGRVLGAAEGLFGLDRALAGRDPSLDVFVIVDLDEAGIAPRATALVEALGRRLLARYSHILGRHGARRLTLAPVVVLSGARASGATAEAERALGHFEALASEAASASDQALLPRVLVLETQSARYELSRGELGSTVVSFLALLLTTALRHEEPMQSFLRAGPEQLRERRCFASFGCATLELSTARYVATAAARDVVRWARTPPPDVVSRADAEAQRLIPSAQDLTARVRSDEGQADLIEMLRAQAPSVELPPIGWNDTPELIRDVRFGWGWFDSLQETVAALVRRLDQSEMDELARLADERGNRMASELVRDCAREVASRERDGALGFWRALWLSQRARAIVGRERDALAGDLKTRALVTFPKPTAVENALRALRQESTVRPRPYRLVGYSVLAAVIASIFLMHLPKWLVAVASRRVPLLSLTPSIRDLAPEAGWQRILEPPLSFLLMLAVLLPLALALASRYRRRCHEALLGARETLGAAVTRFLTDRVSSSVIGFYESRLALSLRSWALRTLASLDSLFEREHGRLTALENALSLLERSLESELRRLEGSNEQSGGDLLYRRRSPKEALRGVYADVRPSPDVAERIIESLSRTPEQASDEAPRFLLPGELTRAMEQEVAIEAHVLRKHLAAPVQSFIAEMYDRLTVPLEVRDFDAQSAERTYLFGPTWIADVLEELSKSSPRLPELLPTQDDSRVFVLALRTALPRSAIAILERDT